VIDIGGNIGTFSLLASRFASKGRIFSYEPNAENYQLLLENLALNGTKNVIPHGLQLQAAMGKFNSSGSEGGGGFHSIRQQQGTQPHKCELVDAVALRDILTRTTSSVATF